LIDELDEISFNGHTNISGRHKNTIEVTKDADISKRADCILGVNATKSCIDLSERLKDWIHSGLWLQFEIKVNGQSFLFEGQGNSRLDLSDRKELVLRRSDYLSSRTAAINCTHSACDIPRAMVSSLKNPKAEGRLIIRISRRTNEVDFVWTLP
jgi:uncharacterized protein